MEEKGYKSFTHPMQTRYGEILEVGKIYKVTREIKFGNNGYGYHFCKNMEDTLKYVDGFNDVIDICEVIGRGQIVEREDEYYGYYNLYCTNEIEIVKLLSRAEILLLVDRMYQHQVKRFVEGFKLNESEINNLLNKYNSIYDIDVINAIKYHQLNEKDVYERMNTPYIKKIKGTDIN